MPDQTLTSMMDMVDRPPDPTAGEDEPIDETTDLTVIEAIKAFKDEAEDARKNRDGKNKINLDAYFGEQDWSEKEDGQSKEFLPKVAMAAEQLAAFIKRGMVAFGDWFEPELYQNPLDPNPMALSPGGVRKLMLKFMSTDDDECPKHLDFATVMSDGVKSGSLTSLVILKIHGEKVPTRSYSVEQQPLEMPPEMAQMPPEMQVAMQQQMQPQEVLQATERDKWRLAIDLIPVEDYYPDPSGRGLYEIHSVERDLHEVVQMSEGDNPIYDPEAVARIEEDFEDDEHEQDQERRSGHAPTTRPAFRKTVRIDEFWGTLLDRKGHVLARNVVAAIANEKYLIRRPEPNPLWHQSSPFVVAPLVRVPHSVFHKALYDHATNLNLAANELFNLMLDGGIAAVWGTRQVKPDWLENPDEISNGIPQGATLRIKMEVPAGAKVLERVDTGEVPREAMAMFQQIDHEFQLASLSTDLKSGVTPRADVKATAIVEAEQQSSILFDGMIFDLENNLIRPALRKIWLTILQNADDWDADDTVACIGPMAANALGQMSPAQRFANYAKGYKFKVTGLSGLASRVREFQKIMALMQSISSNPLLMQAFFKTYSADKVLKQVLKVLNINPENFQLTPEEQMMEQQRMQQLQAFQGMVQGSGANRGAGGGAGMSAPQIGETQLPAEVNQLSNPLTGM